MRAGEQRVGFLFRGVVGFGVRLVDAQVPVIHDRDGNGNSKVQPDAEQGVVIDFSG